MRQTASPSSLELAKWINSGHYNQSQDALTKMLEVFKVVFVEEVLDILKP